MANYEYNNGVVLLYNILNNALPVAPDGAYNQWASIQPTYYNTSGNTFTGTYLGDETRVNRYGFIQYPYGSSQAKGVSNTIITNINEDIGGGYRYFSFGTFNTPEWTSHSTSAKLISSMTSSDYFMKTPTFSRTEYKIHGDFWFALVTHFQADYYSSAYVKSPVGNASYNSFDIIDDSGVKKIKVSATDQYGFYVEGNKYITTGSEPGYLTTGEHWRPLSNGAVIDSSSTSGLTATVKYHWNIIPVDYYFIARSFTPSISKSGNYLYISSSVTPQNGYNVYLDGSLYTTTSSTSILIPTQYRVGSHTWSVTAIPDTSVRNIKGKLTYYTYDADTSLWAPDMYYITGDAYTSSSTASTSYSIKLSTPNIYSATLLTPNSIKIQWYAITNATSYSVKLNNGSWTSVSTNVTHTFTNVPLGSNTVYVRANYSNTTFNSDPASRAVTTSVLPSPTNISINRTGAKTVGITWGTVTYATSYRITINGTSYTTANASYGAELLPGSNSISVTALYSDSSYNSSATTVTYNLTQLSQPLASGVENLNANGGVESITMNWSAVTYATRYLIRDTFTYFDDNTDSDVTEYIYYDSDGLQFSITPTLLLPGLHIFQVQAKSEASGNSLLDSEWSNRQDILDIRVNVLPAPTIVWKSSETGKLRDESTIIWDTPVDPNDPTNKPDYYRIYMIASNDTVLPVTTVIDSNNNYKDVTEITGIPASSQTYAVTVYPFSYNTLYHKSVDVSNTLSYSIIKLEAPTSLQYDPATLTLSWSPTTYANTYYVYEVVEGSNDAFYGSTSNTSYQFETPFDYGLHYLYVVAGRITEED